MDELGSFGERAKMMALLTGSAILFFISLRLPERAAILFAAALLVVTVVGTETAYATLLMLAVLALCRAEKTATTQHSLVSGTVLALSQYVRTTSMLLLPAFLLNAWFRLSGRAALRSILEVQSRYHAPYAPMVIALAAMLTKRVPRELDRPQP